MAYPMLEYWKKNFENNMDGVGLCDVIKRAISVASIYYPDELKKRRNQIVEDLYDDRTKYEVRNANQVPQAKEATTKIIKEDDKKTTSTLTHQEISSCLDDDKKTALSKVKNNSACALKKDDMMKTKLMAPKVSMCLNDEEAIQNKLKESKRKLHERYEQEAAAKKQRVLKVLKLDELPKIEHSPSSKATCPRNPQATSCISNMLI